MGCQFYCIYKVFIIIKVNNYYEMEYLEESQFLLKISWICFPCFLFQYINGKYPIAYGTLSVLITSNLYWFQPIDGFRRNLDMMCVVFVGLHNSYIAYDAEMGLYLYASYIIATYFYLMGWYYFKKGYVKKSIYCHAMLHLCANVGNILLSLGEIS